MPTKRTDDGPRSRNVWVFQLSIIVGVVCVLYSLFNVETIKETVVGKPEKKVIQELTFFPEIPKDHKNRTQIGKEKATLFMLVRNEELRGALETMREIEDRFNHRYRYPWTFLNDKEFTEEFKEMTRGMASGKVEHGLVGPEHWSLPDDIDEEKLERCMQDMEEREVVYGNSLSYRHMCRFNSGFFFEHPLMLQYDWYWRVEPEVHYFCDQLYDPFSFMAKNDKKYGFVIAILEYPETIPTLWNVSREFFQAYPQYIAEDSALDFILDNEQLRPDDLVLEKDFDYNLCHFWSNFEIANLNFFRTEGYREFFKHLDKARGFYYERWGDAPVHTIGVSALLNKSQIHHFSDIGYKHEPYHRCPKDDASYVTGRCLCPTSEGLDVDFETFSCLPKWWRHAGRYFMFNQSDEP